MGQSPLLPTGRADPTVRPFLLSPLRSINLSNCQPSAYDLFPNFRSQVHLPAVHIIPLRPIWARLRRAYRRAERPKTTYLTRQLRPVQLVTTHDPRTAAGASSLRAEAPKGTQRAKQSCDTLCPLSLLSQIQHSNNFNQNRKTQTEK
jgi:hypothetical protein